MSKNKSQKEYRLAADIAIFTVKDQALHILLVKRAERDDDPFSGMWALPGGFHRMELDDDIKDTAIRVLKAETGADAPYVEQLYTFSNKKRDPRFYVTSVGHFALMPYQSVRLNAGHGTTEAKWVPVRNNTVKRKLAFDHNIIVDMAIERVRSKLQYTAIAGHLLGEEFTRPQLLEVYEIILGCKLDKTHFNRSLVRADVLESTGRKEESKGHKRAELFRFKDGADTALFFPRGLVRASSKKDEG